MSLERSPSHVFVAFGGLEIPVPVEVPEEQRVLFARETYKWRAQFACDPVTGEPVVAKPRKKDPAAVKLGRKGGLKGGPARAAKLTAEERSEAARKAVSARWAKRKKS